MLVGGQKMKKLAVLLALMLSLTSITLLGCGGGREDSTVTYIDVSLPHGGFGTAWMEEAATQYEQLHKGTSFEEGKTGVKIRVSQQRSTYVPSTSDGNDIVVTGVSQPAKDLYSKGFLMDLEELYNRPSKYDASGKSIAERINLTASYQDLCGDGHHYGVTTYQAYTGLSYNREVFNRHGLFFAADGEGVSVDTGFGVANFVTDDEEVTEGSYPCALSNGPDHTPETMDDGLPATLQELVMLCGQMIKCGVEPIIFSGQFKQYADNLVSGLWTSLAGFDAMQSYYTLQGGPVEVIDGKYTQDPDNEVSIEDFMADSLVSGLDKASTVKKVKTKWVDAITKENGYLIDDMAAKYYALAFAEICEKEGFFSSKTYSGASHSDAQVAFMTGGYSGQTEIGMLCEETFWWNELEYNELTAQIEALAKKKYNEIDVRFMPLPTALDDAAVSAREAKYSELGKECDWSNTMYTSKLGQIIVTSQTANDPVHAEAVLDFVDYLTSSEVLLNTTKSLGMACSFDNYYESGTNPCKDKSIFSADLMDLASNSRIIYIAANNDFYRKSSTGRNLGSYSWAFNFDGDNVLITNIRDKNHTAAEMFHGLRLTPAAWRNQLQIFGM